MAILDRGRYRARVATGARDLAQAQALRALAFRIPAPDLDRFDDICTHVLVHDTASDALVCCFRLLVLNGGGDLGRSYSAQFYDLSALERFPGGVAEIGRFCIRPGCHDADILRLAWGAIAALVDEHAVELLIGCSSFAGTEPGRYLDAFALLRARYLVPERWSVRVRAPEVFRFAAKLRRRPDMRRALAGMPPLLRSYLAMGGWVSDHAVVDRRIDTLHVFTGLEVAAMPPARKRLLRALAGGSAPPVPQRTGPGVDAPRAGG